MITVLATGVGGPLGQALVKAARISRVPCRLLGTDRASLSVGLHWVDTGFVLPDCTREDEYLAEMIALCTREGVQAILPGSDGELRLLARHAEAIHAASGACVIAGSPEMVDIALDKYETCRLLERAGLRYPRYALLDDEGATAGLVAEFGYPLFAKPRKGAGSQRIMKIRDAEDLRYLRSLGIAFVVQELLEPEEEEYTVAVFTEREGRQVGSIAMRRELVAGNTYRAWVVHHEAVEQEARAAVAALRASGPCNVQLRATARGPVTFEINPRFSGTTAMRAHFGYNEVEMALTSFVLGEVVPDPQVRDGVALRFWDEYYLDAAPV